MSTFVVSGASFSSPPPLPSVLNKSNTKQDVKRNTIIPHPSIWGDQFLIYDEEEDLVVEKQLVEELKEEVKKVQKIKLASNDAKQHMKLIQDIDVIQRLGIAYHFEKEIEEALQHIYVTYGDQFLDDDNLQNVSLWFRILRQQGFNVSSGIFKNYIDDKGNFKESLCDDAQGMLGMYEASNMRVAGEQVLDDALEFTKIHLHMIATNPSCDSSLRTNIQQALKRPLRKKLPRLEAVRYIPIYQEEASHNEFLLKLAKLDFNILQSLHKRELSQLCKWWKDLDMQTKLPHVRDRLVEGYFWILGIYFEPQHSRSRIFLTKSCMWLVVLDDTFDNYGTFEELEIFTQAVERWSMSCMDMLPEYMKLIYQELLHHHQEMEESLKNEGKAYQIEHVKEMTKEYVRSIYVEAKWLKEGYTPTLEEYIANSLVTVSYPLMIGRSYVGVGDMLGNIVTEETFKWVAKFPPLVKAPCLIFRIMDDIGTREKEHEREHGASCIDLYVMETGASEEEACEFFTKQVEDEWKVINRDCLRPTDVPFLVVAPIINLARAIDTLYKCNDGFGHAEEEMKSYIKSLFVYPIDV